MTRLDKLIALAQRTGLLRADEGDNQRLTNAIAFTHLAAFELRDEGFRTVKSRDPKDSNSIVPGEIANPNTRERFRIIANLDSANQAVVMEELPAMTSARWGVRNDDDCAPLLDPTTSPELMGALTGAASKKGSHKSGKGHEGGASAHS